MYCKFAQCGRRAKYSAIPFIFFYVHQRDILVVEVLATFTSLGIILNHNHVDEYVRSESVEISFDGYRLVFIVNVIPTL